jgi:hypothetical protein
MGKEARKLWLILYTIGFFSFEIGKRRGIHQTLEMDGELSRRLEELLSL